MKTCVIYHNPRCSKSRKALELLQTFDTQLKVIEYLKTPFNLEQLIELRANFDLKDFIRIDEPAFKNLNLNLEREVEILEALLKEPILMQRPIVNYNGRAIIARPPEKIFELFK